MKLQYLQLNDNCNATTKLPLPAFERTRASRSKVGRKSMLKAASNLRLGGVLYRSSAWAQRGWDMTVTVRKCPVGYCRQGLRATAPPLMGQSQEGDEIVSHNCLASRCPSDPGPPPRRPRPPLLRYPSAGEPRPFCALPIENPRKCDPGITCRAPVSAVTGSNRGH